MKKLLAFLLLLPCIASADSKVAKWSPAADKSSINWSINYSGKPLTGSFTFFQTKIVFDPNQLDKSIVEVNVDTTKIKSSDKDAMENLPAEDWFNSKLFPIASFQSTNFKHVSRDGYEAKGTLTIKDKSIPFTLPFTVKFSSDKKSATVDSVFTIKRLDFGLGTGEWKKTDVMEDAVKVNVHLEATD